MALIELIIAIVIIGILTTVAVPQYARYTYRAKFADVIAQIEPYKIATSLRTQDRNEVVAYDDSDEGAPPQISHTITNGTGGHAAVLIVQSGTIRAIGTDGIDRAIYELTPDVSSGNNTLTWVLTATGTTSLA